jgi:diguanylate cyclase (GGDEF)-like protein
MNTQSIRKNVNKMPSVSRQVDAPKMRWNSPVLILVCVLILASYIVLTFTFPDQNVRLAASDIYPAIINLLAVVFLFWAAYVSKAISKRLGLAWLLIAVGQLFYALGDTIWAILELNGQTPYPSIADYFYLAYYPIFFIGTVLLSLENFATKQKVKNSLDMAIIMSGVLLGFWFFLLQPILNSTTGESWIEQALTLAYPAGDIMLFAALLWLLNSNPRYYARPPVVILIISTSIMIFTDTTFSYQSAMGIYQSGGWLDIGWMVSYLLIIVGALHQVSVARLKDVLKEPEFAELHHDSLMNRVLSFLPYLWLVLAYLILFNVKKSEYAESFNRIYIWVGVTVGLVLLRQVWAFLEIKKLNDKLKDALVQVRQQTRILESINRELESEIQQRIRMEEQLSYDATHDSLTNLPNRAAFINHLEQSLKTIRSQSQKTFSVLFMDIDQFKVINDSLGHTMGDQLLVILARRLSSCLRAGDVVARLGGDEFVFIIQNTDTKAAIDLIANRIREEVHKVILLGQHPIYITSSIGVVWNLRGYETSGNVLRDADLAMYQAKRLGKDRYEIFDESLRLQAISRLEIAENLRSAVAHKELVLFYQPIQDLFSGKIVGFEALLRWNHPGYGLLHPHEFLGVAEETGLSLPIGTWSFQEACSQFKAWSDRYPFLKKCFVDVNISGTQMVHPDFIKVGKKILKETGVDTSMIRLEITESVLIDYNEDIEKKFAELKALGIQLAIDDFGTGYSSLAYIKNFPIHSLKIDKSFIRDIGQNKSATDVVKTMIGLSQDLGLDVVAEGIESPDQVAELMRLSCRYGQGFLLSLPLTVNEVEELLRDGKQFLE